MPTFGAKLKELRERAGLSQSELADRAGLSQRAISNWEADLRDPVWQNVRAICKALGVGCAAFEETSSPAKRK